MCVSVSGKTSYIEVNQLGRDGDLNPFTGSWYRL